MFDATNPFRQHPQALSRLPRVVRVYVLHTAIGFVLAAIFTALVIGFDIANIGHLVRSVEGGGVATLVFFIFNGIVFSGVQFGIVVMSMPLDDR